MHTKHFPGGARIHYNSDMSGMVRVEHGEGVTAYTITIPGVDLMRWFLSLPLSAFDSVPLDTLTGGAIDNGIIDALTDHCVGGHRCSTVTTTCTRGRDG